MLIASALPGPVRDLLDAPEFRYGLKGGLIAAAVLALPGLFGRRALRPDRGPNIGWAGLVPAVILIFGLERLDGMVSALDRVSGFEWGILALVVGGLLAGLVRWRWFSALCAVPGAAIVCWPGLRDADGTNRWIGFLAIVVLAPLLAEFDRRSAIPGLAPLLALIAVGGQYFTLPDTEKPSLLVGAALPVGLVGWPLGLARLGTAGAFALVGTCAWSAESSGPARPGSIIGAMGTFALLAVAPVIWTWSRRVPRRVAPGRAARTASWSPWALGALTVAVQVLVVLWASRVSGLRDGRADALLLLVPAVALAAWFSAVVPALGPTAGATRGPEHPSLATSRPSRRDRSRASGR